MSLHELPDASDSDDGAAPSALAVPAVPVVVHGYRERKEQGEGGFWVGIEKRRHKRKADQLESELTAVRAQAAVVKTVWD